MVAAPVSDTSSSGSSSSGLEAPPAMNLAVVVGLYARHLARLGLCDIAPTESGGQCLGSGLYGSVYRVRDHVLKLTCDMNEAVASYQLVGRESKRVVRIQSVACLKDTASEKLTEWFVVERELLHPPSESDHRILTTLWNLYEKQQDLLIPTGHQMMSRWRNALPEDFSPRDRARAVFLLEATAAGARELSQVGLQWSDFHPGNLMKRLNGNDKGGVYVIADPGPGFTGWKKKRSIQIPVMRI